MQVSPSDHDQRLDVYLHAALPAHSRAFLQKLIATQHVSRTESLLNWFRIHIDSPTPVEYASHSMLKSFQLGGVCFLVVSVAVDCGCTSQVSASDWPTNSWTVADWPRVAREHSDGLMTMRQKEQSPFDPNRTGDVDRSLWPQFAEARYQRRMKEQTAVWSDLLRRYDNNKDGRLTREEVKEILQEFRELNGMNSQTAAYRLRKHVVSLKYFDVNRDSLLSDVEAAVSYTFEAEARRKRGDAEDVRVGVIWPRK